MTPDHTPTPDHAPSRSRPIQDVLVHVTDVSHPDAELQKATVLSTLRGLHLPPALLESALEVHSKVDLVPG